MGSSASSEQPSEDAEGSLEHSSPPPRSYSYSQDASLLQSLTSSSQQPAAVSRQSSITAAATRASSSSLTATPHGLRPPGSVALAPVLSKHNSTASASTMGQNQSRHGPGGSHGISSPPVKPVAIPEGQAGASKKSHQSQQAQPAQQPDERLLPIIPIGPPSAEPDSYLLPDSEFARPPRLPLPIEPVANEVDIDGSPILSAANLGLDTVPAEEGDFPLVSRASELSSTTVDDDDIGDDLGTVRGGVLPSVPTIIEWMEPGNKVYVTGTFADWDRKYRLTKNGPSKQKDVLSAVINLQPGTYHLRFIVDGDMILSKHLPTAVDFTNSLVNYIEVVPKETTATAGAQTLMPPELQTQSQAPAVVDLQTTIPASQATPPSVVGQQLHQQESHTPTLPPTPAIAPIEGGTPVPPPSETPTQRADVRKAAAAAAAAAAHPLRYTTHIPNFLRDSDAHESSQEFRRSLALSESLPGPPSLPMFLNKSILNGSMPMKDDASVLILPNHTVLNHLATTSIRSGVLATSATTRYKRKFLTTIMYKPTDADH